MSTEWAASSTEHTDVSLWFPVNNFHIQYTHALCLAAFYSTSMNQQHKSLLLFEFFETVISRFILSFHFHSIDYPGGSVETFYGRMQQVVGEHERTCVRRLAFYTEPIQSKSRLVSLCETCGFYSEVIWIERLSFCPIRMVCDTDLWGRKWHDPMEFVEQQNINHAKVFHISFDRTIT